MSCNQRSEERAWRKQRPITLSRIESKDQELWDLEVFPWEDKECGCCLVFVINSFLQCTRSATRDCNPI